MTKAEKMYLRKMEEAEYNYLAAIESMYGKDSTQAREQRARWCAMYDMCTALLERDEELSKILTI